MKKFSLSGNKTVALISMLSNVLHFTRYFGVHNKIIFINGRNKFSKQPHI